MAVGKNSDHKKMYSMECAYCDFRVCRKGHKCKWYKKFVKNNGNTKQKHRNKIYEDEDYGKDI